MTTKAVLFGLILFVSVFMLLASTSQHIGACPDSTVYVGVAKNWLAGNGLTMPVIGAPLTHYPPLYPLLLSASGLLGIPILQWALGWNILLLLANILLAGRIAAHLGLQNHLLPVALVAFSPGILTLHWMVWSEPVFLFLGFSGLLATHFYLQTRRPVYLWLAGLVLGLCWLARYSGVAFIAAACGGLWLFSERRWRDVLICALSATSAMLIWMTWNAVRYDNTINRVIGFRPVTPQEAFTLIAELLLAWAIFQIIRRQQAGRLAHLLALFLFAYLAVLAITVCLVDSATPVFDTRIQAPVLYAGLLLLPWLAGRVPARIAKPFASLLILVMILQLAGSMLYTTVGFTKGLDFSDGSWSQEMQSIPAHPWN